MASNKNILVAVDFNEASDALLEYVSQDVHKGDHVTLLYVLNQGYMGVNLASGMLPFNRESRRLREMTQKYFSDFEKVDNQIGFDPNSSGDGIVRFADNNHVDVIYIGSRDKHNLLDKLLGSTCLKVVNQAKCDVVVIPFGTKFQPARKMLLASDEGVVDVLSADRLKRWKGRHMFFLHVNDNSDNDFEQEKKEMLIKLFDENDVGFSFGVQTVIGGDTVKAILSFAHNEGVDRILLRKSDQSLISTLFLSSTTKEIIDKSVIPLIFLTTKK